MADVVLQDVTKVFADGTRAVDGLDLDIAAVTDETRELAEDIGEDRPVDQRAALVGRFSSRTLVANGDEIHVAVDPDALHFFDPETGLSIRK